MDRRRFLQAATLAATAAGPLAAQSYGAAPTAPPAYPPLDARTVWLVGDSGRVEPAALVAQLAALTPRTGTIADTYLADGAMADLEHKAGALFGKEDAAFFPTGTMANNIAVRVLAGEKSRVIVQHESHLYADESDTVQRLGKINLVPLAAGRATPSLAEVTTAIDEAEKGRFPLKVGAISIESPVRRMDGELVPPDSVAAIASLAKAHGIGLHFDAARLLLAPPSLDVMRYAAPFDTVYLSLYKYLGAPFGAVLAGSKANIAEARELRHVYGGMIYQGWMPALIAADALPSFPARIARAHAAAERLIAQLEASGKVRRRPHPNASNIYQLETTEAFAAAAFERGRAAGVHVARWKDGAMPIYVNDTITRRPVEELRALIVG